ncbi:MAG: HD-GYP domain-containing protein [Actinobacteria bacterium]|nr:HD-GYP domain-containing protein [Actinomycetota bacterium]
MFDRMEQVERRRRQLSILSYVIIFVLAASIAFFFFTVKTLSNIFSIIYLNFALIFGFAFLIIIFIVYLNFREKELRDLNRDLFQQIEDKSLQLADNLSKLSLLNNMALKLSSAKTFSDLEASLSFFVGNTGIDGMSVALLSEKRNELYKLTKHKNPEGISTDKNLLLVNMIDAVTQSIKCSNKRTVFPDDFRDSELAQSTALSGTCAVGIPSCFSGSAYSTLVIWGSNADFVCHESSFNIFESLLLQLELKARNINLLLLKDDVMRELLKVLASSIEFKDPLKAGHSARVMKLANDIGERLGFSEHQLRTMSIGCILHDVGYLSISSEIISKPSALTSEERFLVMSHPDLGIELLKNIKFDKEVFDVIKYHHERYDGKGYPDGIKSEDIPLVGRIVAIADAFDAMINPRAYRDALTVEEALKELIRGSGTQFDPQIVGIFRSVIESSEI